MGSAERECYHASTRVIAAGPMLLADGRGTISSAAHTMVDTLRSYGVNEQEVAADDLAAHAARIRLAGYSVLAGAFNTRETADFAPRLDEGLRRQTQEFGT